MTETVVIIAFVLMVLAGGVYCFTRLIIHYHQSIKTLQARQITANVRLNSKFNAIWRQLSALEKQENYHLWNGRKYSKCFSLMKQYREIVKKIDAWLNADHLYKVFLLDDLPLLNEQIERCEYFIRQLRELEDAVWKKMRDETNVKAYTLMLVFMTEIYDFRKYYPEKLLAGLKEQKKTFAR